MFFPRKDFLFVLNMMFVPYPTVVLILNLEASEHMLKWWERDPQNQVQKLGGRKEGALFPQACQMQTSTVQNFDPHSAFFNIFIFCYKILTGNGTGQPVLSVVAGGF